MINILSYVGMNMQSEVCLWCLLGLVRTIFDATLFKVNANLKQVWQMTMPAELSMPVQRVLRTMVSGVMLAQCFTVYVYLAAYIVLLYPVFLEERPTLVLPWLLLAAIRKLLCELTSLALGLGTCVLLGPARPPCIKFVVVKFTSIMPAFYMWMLVFSYYHALKVASAFKTFPAVLPPNDNDYGLELAVRRRRTKSLLGEEQLRKKLVANFYGERSSSITNETYLKPVIEISSRMVHSTDTSLEEAVPETDVMKPLTMSTTGWSDIGAYEDWFGSEVMIPRDTDRILEQIVLMLLRIGAYLKKEGIESIIDSQILNSAVPPTWHQRDNIDCAAINADDTDTPPLVGSSKGNMASYLREYPQIFMKKQGTEIPQTERTISSLKTVHSYVESEEDITSNNKIRTPTSDASIETMASEVEKVPSKKRITISDSKGNREDTTDKLTMPRPVKSKQLAITVGKKLKTKRNKHLDSESHSKENMSESLKMKKYPEKSETLDEDNKKIYSNSKILSENNNNELLQSKILANAKNTNSTDSKIINQDKTNEIIQSKMSNNANTYPEFTECKISTDAIAQASKDNKVLNEGNNNKSLDNTLLKQDDNKKLPRSKISANSKTKTSKNSKIIKQDSNNEFIQNKLPTNEKTLPSINSKTHHEESANSEILKQDKDFKQSEISTSAKIQNSMDSQIITQVNNNEFIQSKTSNKAKHTTSSKTMDEDQNKDSMDIKILKQDNNKEFTESKNTPNTLSQTSKDSKTFNEEKNKKNTDSKLLKQANSYEFTQSKIPSQNSMDDKVIKQDNTEELTHSKTTNEFFTDSKILNEIQNKDFKHSEMSNSGISKELSLNKLHEDTSNQSCTNSKFSNLDKNEESAIEDKSNEYTNSKLLIGAENQECCDNKIPHHDNDNESLNTSACSTLNEQNSKQTENNNTKKPDS